MHIGAPHPREIYISLCRMELYKKKRFYLSILITVSLSFGKHVEIYIYNGMRIDMTIFFINVIIHA